ncbi:DNA polymerase III subunit delta [Candidatus Uhrbacteria bacterium]|nr:DNA polymerase III subunit delta [Candidatus Uhrbacteria bacterium]
MKKTPNIYLFCGPDSFSITEKITSWKARFAQKYGAGGISVFDCEELGDDVLMLQGVKNALSGRTLFSAISLIIIKNVFSKKAGGCQEMLCRYLPALSSDAFCVLIDEKRDPKSELSKLLTQLSKEGVCSIEEFIIPAGHALKKWLVARAQHHGGSFEPRALVFFTGALEQQGDTKEDASGISLWHLDNEIRKLVSYSAGKPITAAAIEALSCLPASAHIFELSDALLAGNTATALHNIHRLIGPYKTGMHAPLLRALAFLMTQFRSFLILKNMEEGGEPEQVIAETLSWNPRRVWVVRNKLSRHTTTSMKSAYTGLLDLERIIKTGSGDALLSFDIFIKKTTEPAQ